MSTILLVRHGQAAWGSRDYDRLTKMGVMQAHALGASFAAQALAPRVLVTGGMRRHDQTAVALAAGADWTSAWVVDARFAEFDHMNVIHAHRPAYRYGALMRADLARTFRPRSAFWKMFDAAIARWRSGEHEVDYTETYAAFAARVDAGLAALRTTLGDNEVAIVVTSAGVMATVAANALDRDSTTLWRALFRSAANTGIHTLDAGPGHLRVVSLNAHTHLVADGLVTSR